MLKVLKLVIMLFRLYTPECGSCEYCKSGKTNLCQAIRETQGQGLMPDGTSRFSLGTEKMYTIIWEPRHSPTIQLYQRSH